MRWYYKDLEAAYPGLFAIDVARSETSWEVFYDLSIAPIIAYLLLWTIPYALIMFVLCAKRIKSRGYQTMYGFYEGMLKNVIGIFGEKLKPAVYMALHGVAVSLSFLLSQVLWRSFAANTVYLVVLIAISIWNGSTFYFEVRTCTQDLSYLLWIYSNDLFTMYSSYLSLIPYISSMISMHV
jgi:hypothetical protein